VAKDAAAAVGRFNEPEAAVVIPLDQGSLETVIFHQH
jgi:hypothetical protein